MFRKAASLIALIALMTWITGRAPLAYSAGFRDHPLFRRPNGYEIADYAVSEGALNILGHPAFLIAKITEIT